MHIFFIQTHKSGISNKHFSGNTFRFSPLDWIIHTHAARTWINFSSHLHRFMFLMAYAISVVSRIISNETVVIVLCHSLLTIFWTVIMVVVKRRFGAIGKCLWFLNKPTVSVFLGLCLHMVIRCLLGQIRQYID